ncbi:hypothetical protein EDD21DRAFT_217905 [Dissophora ornata]|nr:hypothetical protein EDD21DRAFT_217905 [Dissophora ornata]
MSFTLETTLDTKTPNVVEFLGPPSPQVQHQISGVVRLLVQKAVQLKHLFVTFHGEVVVSYVGTTTFNIAFDTNRIEAQLVNTQTQYQPGEYTFPFQLALPGDLATTPCTSLKSNRVTWAYNLATSAVPSGLFTRRKALRQPLTLRRVHVPPSDTFDVRYGAKRAGEFECSMYAPKFISSQEKTLHLSVFLHPYSPTHRVKEILAQVIQTEKTSFDPNMTEQPIRDMQNLLPPGLIENQMAMGAIERRQEDSRPAPVKTHEARAISKTITIQNPDQEEFMTEWGREHAVEFQLDIDHSEMVPSETLDWLEISHGIRFTIIFADSKVRNLVVMAPFQIANVLQEAWSTQPAPEGLTPPDYGIGDDHSTLLDSNTARVMRNQLHRELYPEREPVVPDTADDLPPVYEHEGECPMPYSEK